MVVDPADDASSDARAVASAAEIQLYDSTSPFAYEHWALVGLEREGEMFSASKTLSDNLTAVFAASLVVGLLIAVVAAWLSSSRLRHLMSEVRAAQPEQPIAFTPTGIVEVDELSEAIESMGEEVAMTASRYRASCACPTAASAPSSTATKQMSSPLPTGSSPRCRRWNLLIPRTSIRSALRRGR